MKTIRLLVTSGLLLGLASLAGAKEAKTYTLNGFFTQGRPADELIQQAAKAVEARMAGLTQVGLPEDADHHVEVIFRRDSFEVCVDGLPFQGRRVGTAPDLSLRTVPVDYAMERAQDKTTPN